jgi:hypothetical protein
LPKRLKVSLKAEPALTASRVSVANDRLVYLLVANKLLHYRYGNSKIAYIGTTQKGIDRIAQSVAARAESILRLHGVNGFQVRILTCRRRKHVSTWKKLERASLLVFRKEFGEVPRFNKQGSKIKETDEFRYFKYGRISELIAKLSEG